jgi:hypothetical protein
MKHLLYLIFILHVFVGASAQTQMPASLKSVLAISRSDFSHPRFLYGIKPLPGVKDSKLDIVFRPFKMVYQIGYVKNAVVITDPSLFIGFYGFNYPAIAQLDTIWSRPGDTTSEPCVHNLLCDLFLNSYESFETSDPKTCKLLVFDLSKNTKLAEKIESVTSMPASARKLFYLFWDTRIQPDLPEGFSGDGMIEMEVTKPIKIPKSKAAIAEAKPAPPAEPIVKAVPPAKTVPEPSPKPKESSSSQKMKQESAGKKQNQDITKKTESKTPSAKEVTVRPIVPATILIHAPEISKSLYPDLWEYARKQTPSLDPNDIILTLSKRNDSLIAFSKSLKKVTNSYPLPLRSFPVSLRSAENGLPPELATPKVKTFLSKNLKSLAFSYKGQELLFSDDKTFTILQIPECFSNRPDIKAYWDTEAKLSWSVEQGSGDTLFVNLEKAPLSLTIIDDKTNTPVNGSLVTIRVQGKIVNSLIMNSSGEIKDLFRLESVYQLSVQHDDYYTKLLSLSRKDFDVGKTILLINQPAYDVFYISATSEMRNQMITSVERKFESVTNLKQPFFLFVSNTDKPLMTSDYKAVKDVFGKVPLLFDDVPNLVTDYDRFSKAIKSKPPSANSKVNLTFYMSKDVFLSQGKAFIDKVTHTFREVFKVDASVNIYLDSEITEQIIADKNKDDKKPNANYHFFSLLNE